MISLSSMRSALLAVQLVAAVAVASTDARAQATARKPSGGDALQVQAVEDFVEAVLADRAGDFDTAVRKYESANRITPHANTYYNIAELYRRMEKPERAVANYKKYLELAPRATDRAAVTKLIEQLERTPGKAVIDGEDLDGVIFFDGKLLGPSPQIITLPDTERHQVDRVTPKGHADRVLVVSPMRVQHVKMTPSKEELGNVVFSKSPELANGDLMIDGVEVRVPGRATVNPGRHRVEYKGNGCAPVEVVVPAAKEVTFVYFAGAKRREGQTCVPITVQQTRVRFPS